MSVEAIAEVGVQPIAEEIAEHGMDQEEEDAHADQRQRGEVDVEIGAQAPALALAAEHRGERGARRPREVLAEATAQRRVVSEDLPPGVYQSAGGGRCMWEHRMGFTGAPWEVLDDGLAFGVAIVEIAPFEVGFRSRGCGSWRWVGPPTL